MKLIIFDLDGVLIDAKKIHFQSLNYALSKIDDKYKIEWNEHLGKYDGLKTDQKLKMLVSDKGLPEIYLKKIWDIKQEKTHEMFLKISENLNIKDTIIKLHNDGYKIACCSNSIRKTVLIALDKLGIIDYFDVILSNQDVSMSKPHPEIYWKAMIECKSKPNETLIIEDSPVGLKAAFDSNANFMRVEGPSDILYESISSKIKSIKDMSEPKWENKKMNVVIPMAGAGSRFKSEGYELPKPLIDVNGKPMIQIVFENLNIDANFIFIVQKSHRSEYNLDIILNNISPGCKIVEVDGITEGAACTVLLAKDYIDNDYPLFLSNSDQFVEWRSNDFFYKMQETGSDGGIVTFTDDNPKWSFAKTDDNDVVVEVAEKLPISNNATVGFYYWKKGSYFVKYAEQMMDKDIRVNNEFYVCPVFNQAIEDDKIIRIHKIDKMWGLGTPEDLKKYIKK